MIKVEHTEVFNFEGAIRGMRNPLNSWDKSDSGNGCCKSTNYQKFVLCDNCPEKCVGNALCDRENSYYQIGENDLALMRRLYKAGADGNFAHRKFLRQIFVSMDITAPDYFFKEFSTYKVGVTENSTSTMHRIHSKEFTLDDFSHEHLYTDRLSAYCPKEMLEKQIKALNFWRNRYLETKDKHDWWQMIQLLPMSYNYTRTVTMNYENVLNMIKQRTGHKLDEWNEFVDILWELPYLKEIAEEDEHAVSD